MTAAKTFVIRNGHPSSQAVESSEKGAEIGGLIGNILNTHPMTNGMGDAVELGARIIGLSVDWDRGKHED